MKVEKKTIITVEMSDRQWRAFQFVARVVADATNANLEQLYDTTDVDYAAFGFKTLTDAHRAADELVHTDKDAE